MSRRLLAICLLTAVAGLAACASASARITKIATLSLSASPYGIGAPNMASSGSTLVAADTDGLGHVYVEPLGGWSDRAPAATLFDSGGARAVRTGGEPTGVAVSGGAVVLEETTPSLTGPTFFDMFVEPAGGWSGFVAQSARLVASDGARLNDPAIDGSVVAAVGYSQARRGTAIYVFVRPAGGWSGTVHESAVLTDSNPGVQLINDVAVEGRRVVADRPGLFPHYGRIADVFSEPPSGWSGDVHQSRILKGSPSGAPSLAGGVLESGLDVFERPFGSAARDSKPSATVWLDGASFGAVAESLSPGAFSGSLLAFSTSAPGYAHQCPCAATVYLATEPAGGWFGQIATVPALHFTNDAGGITLAAASHNLFASDGTSIAVYRVTGTEGFKAGLAVISGAHVTGLAHGRPRLALRIASGRGAAPIGALTLALPRGLSFASGRALAHALHTNRAAFPSRLRLAHGRLSFQVSEVKSISLTIRASGIMESSALRRAAVAARRSGRHLRLTARVTVSTILNAKTTERASIQAP